MMSKMITGRGEIDVILWFALVSTIYLAFSGKFMNFKFV